MRRRARVAALLHVVRLRARRRQVLLQLRHAGREPVDVVTAPHGLAGSPKGADVAPSAIEAVVRRCPTCQQHFSGDARFCPFDGDPLAVAEGYRPESDPLLGKLIDGRYEVESVLGEGGMGSVYAVRHRALDKRFAMKVMRADLALEG